MIKKLEKHIGTIKAGYMTYDTMKPASINEMHEKINEVVDAVNKLNEEAENNARIRADHEKQIAKLQHDNSEKANCQENVQDKFAEQRKWIGCVCRFWFNNPDDTVLDYLGKIQTGENGIEYYGKETYDWFPHCEPVKPDDDIIYKGGDNE